MHSYFFKKTSVEAKMWSVCKSSINRHTLFQLLQWLHACRIYIKQQMARAYFSAFIFSPFLTLGCCLVSTLDPLRISRYPLWMNLSLALFPITHATNFLLLVLPLNQSPECYETTSFCSFPAQTFFLQSTAFKSCVFVVLLWDFPLSKWPAHCKENGETVSFDSLDMT